MWNKVVAIVKEHLLLFILHLVLHTALWLDILVIPEDEFHLTSSDSCSRILQQRGFELGSYQCHWRYAPNLPNYIPILYRCCLKIEHSYFFLHSHWPRTQKFSHHELKSGLCTLALSGVCCADLRPHPAAWTHLTLFFSGGQAGIVLRRYHF